MRTEFFSKVLQGQLKKIITRPILAKSKVIILILAIL